MHLPTEFLRRFYGHFDHDGIFTVVAMLKVNEDGTKRGKAHNEIFKWPLREMESFDWDEIHELNRQKYDIYFGEALRDESLLEPEARFSRGIVAECNLSVALSLDIDIVQPGAHVSEDLPATDEDVAEILEAGPVASTLVNSGHGYHAHWFYSSPVLLQNKSDRNQYSRYRKKAHKPFMAAHTKRGWRCDTTHNIDRIWRIPGFQNWKLPEAPVLVEVVFGLDEEERVVYDHEKLLPAQSAKAPTRQLKKPRSTPRRKEEQLERIGDLRKAIQAYCDSNYDAALEAAASSDPEIQETAEEIATRVVYMERVLEGVSIEEKGQRDAALTTVCGILCHLTRNITEFTEDDLEFIVTDILAASLQAWCDDNEDTDLDREMGKAIDKLERIKSKDQDNQSEALKGLRQALANYSPRETDFLDEGSEQEPNTELTDVELLTSGIVTYNGFLYIWDWKENNYFPRELKSKEEVRLALRKCWPQNEDCPFTHAITNEEGQAVDLPIDHILRNYGSIAKDCYYSFLEPKTRFDHATGTFRINARPWRWTEPEHDPKIDEWLKLLGGDDYDVLCDWLAGVIKLNSPCAALYLNGPPGCGKTLFAHGAASLWNDFASLYENSSGEFNDALLNGPVLMVDEDFTSSAKEKPTAVMRRLVAQSTHSVNRKFGAKLRLDGHVRVVIAANNDAVLLSGKEERLSENDTRAMKERVAYVKITDDAARDFMVKNNAGQKLTNQWIQGGNFARHILWLAKERPLEGRGRFLVEGRDSSMHKQMLFQGNERNEVLEWTCLFAEAPLKLNAREKADSPLAAVIGDGIVGINTKLAKENWSVVFSSNNAPSKDVLTHSHLLRHLKSLSPLDTAIQVYIGGKVVRYWVIPLDLILTYADSHDIGDMDAIRENAQKTTNITNKIIGSSIYQSLKA